MNNVWQKIITEVSKWQIVNPCHNCGQSECCTCIGAPGREVGPKKVDYSLVIEDMRARDQFGTEKYGTPLQSFNGRDALVNAYQEALDLCAYSYQHWEETGEMEDLYHEAIKITIRLRSKIFERAGK